MFLNVKDIQDMDLSILIDNITRKDHKDIINAPAGTHHYKLLGYIASQLNNSLIIELGTHCGTSSEALSINPTNKVITYDIDDFYSVKIQPQNVERRMGDIFDLKEESILLDADFIFLDVAHVGDFEWKIFCYLKDNNYNRILILDDIHWSSGMINVWDRIDIVKYDITYIGHGDKSDTRGPAGNVPGTGLVDFSENIKFI